MSMNTMETAYGVEVAESPVLRRPKDSPYGSVPGLEDDELADPAELERQVYRAWFGLVLDLPVRKPCGSWVRPNLTEEGVDFGAFATVDFERLVPKFDGLRYKIEMMREELRDAVIMLSIVIERVPGRAKYVVLKSLRMGIIELDQVMDPDMHSIGKWYLRVRRLREEIRRLSEARWKRGRKPVPSIDEAGS